MSPTPSVRKLPLHVVLALVLTELATSACSMKPSAERMASELFTAARYGHRSLVQDLIKEGAKPDWRDAAGDSPVTVAARTGDWETAEAADDATRSKANGIVAAYTQWHLERGLRSLQHVQHDQKASG